MAERDPLISLWPEKIIPVRHVTVRKDRATVQGPPPIAGAAQRASSPGGCWRLSYAGVLARDFDMSPLRALLARLERGQPIYVGPYDYANGPVKRAGVSATSLYTFTGPYLFTGGYSFEASIQNCTLAADAPQGATDISLNNSPTAPLRAGDYFELPGRLHVLDELNGTAAKIWPPLRASYSSGQKVEIADPRMAAYLDGEASIQLQYGRWGEATLDFLEAPW